VYVPLESSEADGSVELALTLIALFKFSVTFIPRKNSREY